MVKRCKNCNAEYWARWGNEPVTLCPDCRARAVLCDECGVAVIWPADPDQLELFPMLVFRPLSRVETPTAEERYWSLRAKASQAMRRRYPYC